MNRSFLLHTHLLISALLLPVILMFAITGAFYTWGIKGSFESNEYDITLSQPLKKDSSYLHQWLEDILEIKGIQVPSGGGRLKGKGSDYYYEWAGSARVVSVSPSTDQLIAKLTIDESSYYRYLVQLHKGKGGVVFKLYAVVVAIGLVILALSGVIMALRMPKYRLLTQRYLISGSVLFILMLLLN